MRDPAPSNQGSPSRNSSRAGIVAALIAASWMLLPINLTGVLYTAREGVYRKVVDEGHGVPESVRALTNVNFHCSPAASVRPDGTYAGDGGAVTRRVGPDVTVQVDSNGTDTFGPDGDNLFSHLADLAKALRAGDAAGISAGIEALDGDLTTLSAAQSSAGARYNRITRSSDLANDSVLQLKSSLSDVEDVDLAEAAVELQVQEVAYQAALAATGKTIQPSQLDFLR